MLPLPCLPAGGGESVDDVARRLLAFVERVEGEGQGGRHVVLVSHGDALSILAAALLGTPLGQHRTHGLGNGGILRLPPSGALSEAAKCHDFVICFTTFG